MTEGDKLLMEHDKKIDKLEMSIEQLADSIKNLANSVGTSNRKMEDFTTMLNTQNILMEKFTNMDKDLRESFGRAYTRIEKLETIKEKYDTMMMKDFTEMQESLKSAHKRIDAVDSLTTWIARTVGAVLICALMGVIIIK